MYVVVEEECIACLACEIECSNGAIEMIDDLAFIHQDKCDACGDCTEVCPSDAIIQK